MTQTAVRMWDAGLAMLSLTFLIDRFLDWLDDVREPIMPAPIDRLAYQTTPIERLLDRPDA